MWNKKRSLVLSKVCTILFIITALAIMVGGPQIANALIYSSASLLPHMHFYLLISFYTGGSTALVLLVCLYKLLHNIGNEQVFVTQNVVLMRIISWLCILGAIICVISSFYYIPWLYIGCAAGFIGLILRVVKNVIAEAIAIKEENDFTI